MKLKTSYSYFVIADSAIIATAQATEEQDIIDTITHLIVELCNHVFYVLITELAIALVGCCIVSLSIYCIQLSSNGLACQRCMKPIVYSLKAKLNSFA